MPIDTEKNERARDENDGGRAPIARDGITWISSFDGGFGSGVQRLDEVEQADERLGARLAELARDHMLRVAPIGQGAPIRCLAGGSERHFARARVLAGA